MKKQVEVVEVVAAAEMDDDTFVKHIEHRHAADCRIEKFISRNAIGAWIGSYRAFHQRLHAIAVPGQYNHEHEEDE